MRREDFVLEVLYCPQRFFKGVVKQNRKIIFCSYALSTLRVGRWLGWQFTGRFRFFFKNTSKNNAYEVVPQKTFS